MTAPVFPALTSPLATLLPNEIRRNANGGILLFSEGRRWRLIHCDDLSRIANLNRQSMSAGFLQQRSEQRLLPHQDDVYVIGLCSLNGSFNFAEWGVVAPHAIHGNLNHVSQ